MRRIAIAVGDTAGHVYPALAFAEAIRARPGGAQVTFLGTADSIAAEVLARHGEPLVAVPASPIARAGTRGALRALLGMPAAVRAARRVLAKTDARLVVGFGGFVSGSVLIAARTLRLRTAIHEANTEPGLANAWLARLVHRVYLAWPETPLPGGVAVGLPVRRAIAALGPRSAPRDGRLRLLVTSGSRGAPFLAAIVAELIAVLARRRVTLEVLQQPFIERMEEAYTWADVAMARAGANTIAELALAGIPAVLVPLSDAAADHQAANARRWSAAGAGLAITEREWHVHEVADFLATLATDVASWQRCADAARGLARPDAAQAMAVDCDAMMQGRW